MDDQTDAPADTLDRLMAAARDGDGAAYRQFLAEATGRIRAMLVRKTAGDSELEDVLQECLIALHEKRHTLDPGRPVGPWMYAIANYKLIDFWRKRGRSPIVLDDEADMDVAAESFAHVDVAALLGELSDDQAQAIRMTHIEGMTNREAAERIGIGTSAMKLRVHRGMLRLKDIADEQKL
ncbi:sigma-70 family RNA polymerase sigma factor [Aurantiacibacter aquimixticola]|nr:sigma-70 family RNA polymerase sigma factor [Aurantiacibacter aquimixticola]